MAKILFIPVGVVSGIIAGLIGKKAFEGVWSLIDEEEAPSSKHRDVPWKKLVQLSNVLRQQFAGQTLSAIVLPPVVMEDVNPNYWPGFPWMGIAP